MAGCHRADIAAMLVPRDNCIGVRLSAVSTARLWMMSDTGPASDIAVTDGNVTAPFDLTSHVIADGDLAS